VSKKVELYDLINGVLQRNPTLKRQEAERYAIATLKALREFIDLGYTIKLPPLGEFRTTDGAPRKYWHPGTKQLTIIPPKKRVKFNVSKI